MIKLTEKYYLDSDEMQFIVKEKKTRQTGKNTGQEIYEPIAFCGNLKQIKNFMINRIVIDDLDILVNIDKLNEISNKIDKVIEKYYE